MHLPKFQVTTHEFMCANISNFEFIMKFICTLTLVFPENIETLVLFSLRTPLSRSRFTCALIGQYSGALKARDNWKIKFICILLLVFLKNYLKNILFISPALYLCNDQQSCGAQQNSSMAPASPDGKNLSGTSFFKTIETMAMFPFWESIGTLVLYLCVDWWKCGASWDLSMVPTSVPLSVRAGWLAEVDNMFLFKTFLRTPRLFIPCLRWANRFLSDRSPCPCFRRGPARPSVCRRSRSFAFVAVGRGIFFDLFHIASYSDDAAIARSLSTAPKQVRPLKDKSIRYIIANMFWMFEVVM